VPLKADLIFLAHPRHFATSSVQLWNVSVTAFQVQELLIQRTHRLAKPAANSDKLQSKRTSSSRSTGARRPLNKTLSLPNLARSPDGQVQSTAQNYQRECAICAGSEPFPVGILNWAVVD
jgi:hypothetical protein